jgi:hypothetical protein
LPDHMKPLARHWQANRPPPRVQTAPVAKQTPPARAAQPRPELAAAAHHEARERHRLRQLARRRSP